MNLEKSYFKLEDLKPGIYYWKVVAKDRYGWRSESPVYKFEVKKSFMVYLYLAAGMLLALILAAAVFLIH